MMNPRFGVVADDVTGANDIGTKFKNGGLSAFIFDFQNVVKGYVSNDVVIIDTNSRIISPESAYKRVYESSRFLASKGAVQFFNKTCSVFRGNIGVEFDAMLDALDENFAVIVLGFPNNGRQTIDGIHYVHGLLLEESEFANDPVNPMKKSSLADILKAQTKRNVENIYWKHYDKGEKYVRERMEKARQNGGYLIFDIRHNMDLKFVASIIYQEKVICGASAIAEEIAKYYKSEKRVEIKREIPNPDLGILVVAGSLMPQTISQIDYLKSRGVVVCKLNVESILDNKLRKKELDRIVTLANELIKSGKDCIIHTPNSPLEVANIKEKGEKHGYGNYELSKLISSTLAEISHKIIAQSGQRRIIVMGGETSNSFCEEMGVLGLEVGYEIESGLPTCKSIGENPMLLVLKSGSFGTREFLAKAIKQLKETE